MYNFFSKYLLMLQLKEENLEDFILTHNSTEVWQDISFYRHLSLEFLIKYQNKIDSHGLSWNHKISSEVYEQFYKILKNKI